MTAYSYWTGDECPGAKVLTKIELPEEKCGTPIPRGTGGRPADSTLPGARVITKRKF